MGVLQLVMRRFDQAVDVPLGVKYGLGSAANIDDAGESAFLSELPSQTSKGIFSSGSGTLRLVARTGDPAPGMSGFFSIASSVPQLNGSGRIAFSHFVNGTTAEGIWSDRGGSLELVVGSGMYLPGTELNVVTSGPSGFSFNDQNQIAFAAYLKGPGINAVNWKGIWSDITGTLTPVVRGGDSAVEAGPGIIFRDPFLSGLNNRGDILFQATLAGPGVGSTNDTSYWREIQGTRNLVLREGSQAAGVPAGAVYSQLLTVQLNDVGRNTFSAVLFGTDVNTSNDSGIWTERVGGVSLLSREGQQAPGTPPGTVFGDFSTLATSLAQPIVNAMDQVAFRATLTGPGIDASNDVGVWASTLDGSLHSVVREGQLFDVNDDPFIEDLRRISRISLTGGLIKNGFSPLNDRGQLAVSLDFTDSTGGVFVININVPEPSSMPLLFGAILSVLTIRRR